LLEEIGNLKMKIASALVSFVTTFALGAVPPASSFSGTYECASLNRDMPDRIPYYRLPVQVSVKGNEAKVSFKEPNKGEVVLSTGPLKETASEDGWEWRSADYQQYVALQKTQVGRFLTLTHQSGQVRHSAVACMKK
jgi:hypothetical protein